MTDITITSTELTGAIAIITLAIIAALLVFAKWIDTKVGAAEARRIPPNYDEEGA